MLLVYYTIARALGQDHEKNGSGHDTDTSPSVGSDPTADTQRRKLTLAIYKTLFEAKRQDQLAALKTLVEMRDVNQRYKIIDMMLQGLFKVLEESRTEVTMGGIGPDGPVPAEEKLRDAYSRVVENTAFFGDVLLRFPKIVHGYFDPNVRWQALARWGIDFCNRTGVFDTGTYSKLLMLMSQELGFVEKSPDFRNPFRVDEDKILQESELLQKALVKEKRRKRKEEQRAKMKGPRLSRVQDDL